MSAAGMISAGMINAHRGLRFGELKRAYLRPSAFASRDAIEDAMYELYGSDDDGYTAEEPSLDQGVFDRVIEEALAAAHKTPKLGDRFSQRSISATPKYRSGNVASEEIAGALAEHAQQFQTASDRLSFIQSPAFRRMLERANGDFASIVDLRARFESHGGPIVAAILFAPFWLRDLSSWSVPDGVSSSAALRSVLDHLFVQYPLPDPVYEPWSGNEMPSAQAICWLILLGRGESLHRAAPKFGWYIPKKFTHYLAAAPANRTLFQASIRAEISRLGGSELEVDRILADPAFAIDVTAANVSPELRKFWLEAVAQLIRHRARLDDNTTALVLEWAMHLHTERPAIFSMAGRAFAATLELARNYRINLHAWVRNLVWQSHGWDWEWRAGENKVWSVRERTSSVELGEESHAMHHCVRGYDARCAAGTSAIFSLLENGARRVTIELEPGSRRVAQVRGACNRNPTAEESSIVARWLRETRVQNDAIPDTHGMR